MKKEEEKEEKEKGGIVGGEGKRRENGVRRKGRGKEGKGISVMKEESDRREREEWYFDYFIK